MADSPESPDESLSSDIFVVETSANDKESITSSKVAEYLEKVNQEDASSYFNTPSGTPKKINFLQALKQLFNQSEWRDLSQYSP